MIHHSDRAHALLSPSGAGRWAKCPLSPRFAESLGLPEDESPYAAEGTFAHEVAEWSLRTELNVGNPGPFPANVSGYDMGEIMSAVKIYVDYIKHTVPSVRPGDTVLIENRLDLSFLIPESFGSVDTIIYLPTEHQIHVIDFKFGQGVAVKALSEGRVNDQLMCYLVGAIDKLGLWDERSGLKMAVHIAQPRVPNGISQVWVTHSELDQWMGSITIAADAAWLAKGPAIVGKHCKFCHGKGSCKAIAQYFLNYIKPFMMTYLNDNSRILENKLTNKDVVSILEMDSMIRSWLDAVKKHAAAYAQQGTQYPGFKLVETSSRRMWAASDAEIIKQCMTTGLRHDQIYDTKLKSPTQLEKAVGKDMFSSMFCDKVSRGSGAVTIAPETDRRKSVTGKDAAAMFGSFGS